MAGSIIGALKEGAQKTYENEGIQGLRSAAQIQPLDKVVQSALNPVSSSAKINDDNWLDWLRDRARKGDQSALDYYLNYMMSERSAETARNYEKEMNSKRYQIMVEDLKKAGINPYWIESLSGVPSYSGNSVSYSGSNFMSARKASETERNNVTSNALSALGKFISAIGLIALFLA